MWQWLTKIWEHYQVLIVIAGAIVLYVAVGAHTWFQLRTHARNDPDFQLEEEEGQTE